VPVLFEYDLKGLERRGDAAKLQSLVGEHYTHWAKMRAELRPGEPRYQLRPIEELADPPEEEGDEHFTDILVVRLSAQQLEDAGDLARILRQRGVNPPGTAQKAKPAKPPKEPDPEKLDKKWRKPTPLPHPGRQA
jgi:hypothetical protein